MAGPAFPGLSPTREVPHGHRVHVHRYRCDRAGVTEPERLALAGFLAGDAGSIAAIAVDVDAVAMGHLPGRAVAREGWACHGPSDDASPHR